jgi:hypothetical protein
MSGGFTLFYARSDCTRGVLLHEGGDPRYLATKAWYLGMWNNSTFIISKFFWGLSSDLRKETKSTTYAKKCTSKK